MVAVGITLAKAVVPPLRESAADHL